MPNLSQHACFDCRKVFKKPHFYGIGGPNYPCPECGKTMKYMGYKFRAPKTNETKEWENIRASKEVGIEWGTRTIRKEEKIEKPKLSRELQIALGVTKKPKPNK